jgi:hypothetical protein
LIFAVLLSFISARPPFKYIITAFATIPSFYNAISCFPSLNLYYSLLASHPNMIFVLPHSFLFSVHSSFVDTNLQIPNSQAGIAQSV